MAEFDVRKRDLKALLAWLEKNDVKNTKITAKEEAKEAKGGENVGEAVDNRKENVMAHKEVQRLSKVGTARPFMESR